MEFKSMQTTVEMTVAMLHLMKSAKVAGQEITTAVKKDYVAAFYAVKNNNTITAEVIEKIRLLGNILEGIDTEADIKELAQIIVPVAAGTDKFWSCAAEAVFCGVVAGLRTQGKASNDDLWQALITSTEDIAALCASTPQGAIGQAYINATDGKQAASVFSVLMSYVSWLEFTQKNFTLELGPVTFPAQEPEHRIVTGKTKDGMRTRFGH